VDGCQPLPPVALELLRVGERAGGGDGRHEGAAEALTRAGRAVACGRLGAGHCPRDVRAVLSSGVGRRVVLVTRDVGEGLSQEVADVLQRFNLQYYLADATVTAVWGAKVDSRM